MSRYTVNELLCFATVQFNKLNRGVLNSLLLDFYYKEEIVEAKQILLSECEKIALSSDISEFKKNRIGANIEQKHLKDIIDILVAIDFEKGGNLDTIFVAANPNRIPSLGRCNLLSSIEKLQQQSQAQKATLDIVIKSLSALQNKTQSGGETSRSVTPPVTTLDPLIPSLTTTPAPPLLASSLDAVNGAGSGKRKRNISETNASPNLVSKARRGENDLAISTAIRSGSSSIDLAPLVAPESLAVLAAPPAPEPNSLPSESEINAPQSTVSESASAESDSTAPDGQPEVVASTPLAPVSEVDVAAALAAAAAVGEAARVHTNPAISSAVKSARKAAKAAKSAAKDAEVSKAIAAAKEAAAKTKKAEAAAAAASAKAVKVAAAKSPCTATSSSSSSSSSSSTWLTKARKAKKAETVVGNREDGELLGVAPRVKDFFDLFVSNLTETITDFQLKTYLQGHAVEVKDVWLLNSKKKGTKSAKVRIAIEHRNKAKDAGIWPKHIHIKDWVRKPSTKSDV